MSKPCCQRYSGHEDPRSLLFQGLAMLPVADLHGIITVNVYLVLDLDSCVRGNAHIYGLCDDGVCAWLQ